MPALLMSQYREITPSYFEPCGKIWQRVNLERLPGHIAIIMDGNGRWARRQGWERVKGHERAAVAVRESIKSCGVLGVNALSLFAFSADNWSRPKAEVEFLFRLFERTLAEETPELKSNNVRLRCLGAREALPHRLNKKIDEAIQELSDNTGLILSLAVNYGGQQDILQAVNRINKSGVGGEGSG
ncbi:MAG: di-trans,poly-cis-decaprenylcistransferase, partial [Elusimicrobia bacterium]|nr:di-trans,poly-cis-decaprenylcistransferase [Elusimicrobiota bacterium]